MVSHLGRIQPQKCHSYFYPIKISFHETLVQVIPLGNILAIDLYPFKTLLLFNQVHLGRIQPQKCHSYFTRLKLVLITQSNMFA